MSVGAESSAVVPGPPGTVATSVFEAVLSTERLPVRSLPTQTSDPSGVTPIAVGRLPTVTEVILCPVAASSTDTEFEFVSATYSVLPFGVTPTDHGSAPAW
jgi:hypothetical protein